MSDLIERLENLAAHGDKINFIVSTLLIRTLQEAAARIKELETDLKGREAVADSYAEENQRFHDCIEKLEAVRDNWAKRALDYKRRRDAIEAETIEKCAKVAEGMTGRTRGPITREVAQAIRALAKPTEKEEE